MDYDQSLHVWPKYAWWKYAIMPVMSGIIGWLTNILALEMTFYPIDYKGVNWYRINNQPWGLFGWQGIIPTKVAKMADTIVTLMSTKIFKIEDILKRLNSNKFYEAAEVGLTSMIDQIVEEVATIHIPTAWHYIPIAIKDEIILTAKKACPQFIDGFIVDLQANINSVLDVHDMCVTVCIENKEKVNKIFQECGGKEFTFIKKSGFYFGFLFGFLQAALWLFYENIVLLPVFGFILGWLTNYLALKMIFRPISPIKIYCGIQLQGLFLKRQCEVSTAFAKVFCCELLNIESMWKFILSGPNKKNFQKLLRAHSILFTEKLFGGLKPFAVAALGKEGFAKMKEDVAEKVIEKIHDVIPLTYDSTTKELDLEATIRTRMQELSPKDFEAVLHPAFEEDEMTLIFVGGILGSLVGMLQIFLLF